jgi:uncharacterized membrane protein
MTYFVILKSIGLKIHAIIQVASFAIGLTCFNFFYFQEKTLSETITPQIGWIPFIVVGLILVYGAWGVVSKLLALIRHMKLDEALIKTAPAFLFLLFLLGTLLRHINVPLGLFISVALIGFFSTILWLFMPGAKRWSIEEKAAQRYVAGGAILFACIFSALGICRYMSFGTFGDFAIFAHQIWGFSEFSMVQLVGNGLHPFGNHISPVLLLLTPFYWIWPDPRVIFCIQNIVIAAGVIPLYWLSRDHLRSPLAGVVICFGYLLYPALQLSAAAEFHESHLITTLFLFTFYFLQKRAYRNFIIFGLLTIMCKEDITLLIGMCGLYIIYRHRNYKFGSGVILFSAIWLFIGVFVIMPAYEHGGSWYLQFFNNGDANGESLVQMSGLVDEIMQSSNITFILQLLVPLGLLAVLAPVELLITVPTILELVVYSGPPFGLVGSIYTWHVMAVVPTIFIATIFGIKQIMNRMGDSYLSLCLTIIIGCTVFSNIFYGVLPFGLRYDFPDFKLSEHDKKGHALLEQIPLHVSVTTTSQLSAHLANREEIYILPNPWEKSGWRAPMEHFPTRVDYVIADTSLSVIQEMDSTQQEGFLESMRRISRDPTLESVAAQDGYVIYKRIDSGDPQTP